MRAPVTDTHTRSSHLQVKKPKLSAPSTSILFDDDKNINISREYVPALRSESNFDFSYWVALCESKSAVPAIQNLPESFFVFRDLIKLLWRSPSARSLLRFAAQNSWSMTCYSMQDGAYYLEAEEQTMMLNDHGLRHDALLASGYFRHSFILSMLRGLRDIWHLECRQPHIRDLRIEDVLLLERVRTADCDIFAQLIAWELRSDGHPELWRHLIGSPEGDMALSFMRRIERHPASSFDNSVLVYSFREWFSDDSRVSACDHNALDMIDEDLNDPDLKDLYGEGRTSALFLESLSRLPDKTCYLKDYGDVILSDPLFAGLHSEVNQAHYMQIKQELECTTIGHVAFRDLALARKIYPEDI